MIDLRQDYELCTGFTIENGIRMARPEKAFLDTLYFHNRGYTFNFDFYSDPDISSFDMDFFNGCLERYENPKFTAFVKGVLDGLS